MGEGTVAEQVPGTCDPPLAMGLEGGARPRSSGALGWLANRDLTCWLSALIGSPDVPREGDDPPPLLPRRCSAPWEQGWGSVGPS